MPDLTTSPNTRRSVSLSPQPLKTLQRPVSKAPETPKTRSMVSPPPAQRTPKRIRPHGTAKSSPRSGAVRSKKTPPRKRSHSPTPSPRVSPRTKHTPQITNRSVQQETPPTAGQPEEASTSGENCFLVNFI